MTSDKPIVKLARAVLAPLQEFFRLEAASGIVLFCAAAVALALANGPWRDAYQAALSATLPLHLGPLHAELSLLAVINEGLMSIFFFLVGMEIKHELVLGELRTFRAALLPGIGAVGGMLVPAGIYALFNHGGPGAAGWAIPMATDIAFAIGCMRLLGDRAPRGLTVFLLALAIFDDVGGIAVIALFYGHGTSLLWLLVSALIAGGVIAGNRFFRGRWVGYLIAGVALWLAVHASGIHVTIAGVVLGVLVPATGGEHELPPLERFVPALHPWVAYGIMPIFALANSGVALRGPGAAALIGSVPLGAGLGLLLGKPLGIFLFTYLAAKAGLAALPGGVGAPQLLGVATVAGIGFTVALFIAGLAFGELPALLAGAKVGILGGSLLAGVIGYLILRFHGGARATDR